VILPFAQRSVGFIVGLVVLVLLLAGTAPQMRAQQFSARTDLVEVYATVTEDAGRLVTDLGREEFVVLEDGVLQVVSAFAAGNQPVSIAIAVDRSWSMAGDRLAAAQRGGRELLLELEAQDRAMLVAIGSDVDVPVPLTDDRRAIDTALQGLDAWGSTALHDAVITAFDAIEPAPGRRALVLVSDGVERHSQRSADDVRERVRASDVLAYPVVLHGKVSLLLEQLAAITGGRAQRVRQLRDVPATLRRIASELRHQYLLGYTPTRPPRPGEYRRIEVRVTRPKHAVRARAGYLAR
jgi:Ca-activated chloride channel family protein